jgi:hypothetical protein
MLDPHPRSWLQGVADEQRRCFFSKESVITGLEMVSRPSERAVAFSLESLSLKNLISPSYF